jgi:glc operon protein GlcG
LIDFRCGLVGGSALAGLGDGSQAPEVPIMRRILLILTAFAASTAQAQIPAQQMSAATAQAIVAGCAVHSTARKQSQAIAVTDSGGHLVAALRMDGNGQGVMDFAMAKARAAAAWGFGTEQMGEAVRSTPGFADAPHVVTVAGGVPVYSADGTSRIGAVGVSGEAPTDDAACAAAGIAAAGMRMTRASR